MENKKILIRRMIYIALFVLSLVFISFRGGNLPYMLFFMMAANTALSLLYIIYVFFTLKIYQDIPERRITKYETVPYRLNLYNEGLTAYSSVRLTFMDRLSYVNGARRLECSGLEPGKKIDADMELWCRYSGTYYAGVDFIEIMDYFQIFRIRFHMPQKMKVTVKPRIVEMDLAALISEQEEGRDNAFTGKNEYLTDSEVRKYRSGDNKRLIHWKNSAKRQELMVRKQAGEEITRYVVMMDGGIGDGDFESKMMICDRLRETVIGLAYDACRKGYGLRAVLGGEYEREIRGRRDFDDFYNRVTDFHFSVQKKTENKTEKEADRDGLSDRLRMTDRALEEDVSLIVISARPKELLEDVPEEIKNNRSLHVIDVNSLPENGENS